MPARSSMRLAPNSSPRRSPLRRMPTRDSAVRLSGCPKATGITSSPENYSLATAGSRSMAARRIFRCLPARAIVPLGPKTGGPENPETLDVHVFAGADNCFTLYEDDGETTAYLDNAACRTTLAQKWLGSRLEFTIDAPQGDTSLIPDSRR